MREGERFSIPESAPKFESLIDSAGLLVTAKAWIHAIAARDKVLPGGICSDPAWNILLDLYVSMREDRTAFVTDSCLASGAPMTTALRWLSVLEVHGLISRSDDTFDKRRTRIAFTAVGIEKVEGALVGAIASDRRMGIGRLQMIQ